MLRSRVENRPNSSVTDFRRQLNRLQSTATPPRGSMRAMGRPLAQSPLQRPAAAGRPHRAHHAGLARTASSTATAPGAQSSLGAGGTRGIQSAERPRYRSHGDPSGGHPRPEADAEAAPRRRPPAAPARDPRKQRRVNVLFMLVLSSACTLFLAATTSSTVMVYLFAASFLALCGYVYLLAQIRQRASGHWDDHWLERH
jgi:hypothetical protein